MGERPSDFSDFINQQQSYQNEFAASSAVEQAAQLQKEALAIETKRAEQRHLEELANMLQKDASRVAVAAAGKVPEDAIIGRLFARASGWIVSIERRIVDNNDGSHPYVEGNSYVHATILSTRGRLQVANPVLAYPNEKPLDSKPAMARVLRRTSGLVELTKVKPEPHSATETPYGTYDRYRRELAGFVIDNHLNV